MTTPEQQPAIHYWRTHPEADNLPPEEILELFLSVCRALGPAIEAVVQNHIESRMPIVLEGDYLLPEMIAAWTIDRARAVFLYEPDESQLLRNFAAREPAEGKQEKRARVSWLYGQWLRDECKRLGLVALPSRPWNTVLDRIVHTLD